MNGIKIVSHCYAKELPQFAGFLRWQVSSLIHHKCDLPVTLTVCATADDVPTQQVLAWAEPALRSAGVLLEVVELIPCRLWRRSIGRNVATQQGRQAAIVWFTDVDHYFGEGCLDALWQVWHQQVPAPVMVWPEEIRIHKTHAIGDESWWAAMQSTDVLPPVNPDEFTSKRYRRAIGGVQIVAGEYAAKHGYLGSNRRYQRGRTDNRPFGDFRDDVAFRRLCYLAGDVKPVRIPNVYRLRHTATTY